MKGLTHVDRYWSRLITLCLFFSIFISNQFVLRNRIDNTDVFICIILGLIIASISYINIYRGGCDAFIPIWYYLFVVVLMVLLGLFPSMIKAYWPVLFIMINSIVAMSVLSIHSRKKEISEKERRKVIRLLVTIIMLIFFETIEMIWS